MRACWLDIEAYVGIVQSDYPSFLYVVDRSPSPDESRISGSVVLCVVFIALKVTELVGFWSIICTESLNKLLLTFLYRPQIDTLSGPLISRIELMKE